jgi:uncharacterized phage protein (TIGR01671 family)
MSRNIKFRFWSKILNHFVIPNDDIFIGALKDKNMEVMQFTGLKDKYSIDIYELDILKWNQNGRDIFRLVVWDTGQCRYVTSNSRNRVSVAKLLRAGKVYKLNMKVVGNYFENSELLKRKKVIK